MARPKKHQIKLTDEEFLTLKSIIRKKATSKTIRCRCRIILDLDEAHGKVLTHKQSARANGVCMATVTNTVTKYASGGINAVAEFKRNVNSDNALTGRKSFNCCGVKQSIRLIDCLIQVSLWVFQSRLFEEPAEFFFEPQLPLVIDDTFKSKR